MPNEVLDPTIARDWTKASEEELLEGYRAMAADQEREAEALAWSEALIGDGSEAR